MEEKLWLKYLNDVGISTQSIADGWVLTWNESQSKWLGAASAGGGGSVGSGGTWANYDSNTGVTTTKKVKIQNHLEVIGVITASLLKVLLEEQLLPLLEMVRD